MRLLDPFTDSFRLIKIALLLGLGLSALGLNCTLCEDGSYPTDDSARVKYETATYSCEQLHYIAPTVTNATLCANLQSTGRIICMCSAKPAPPCKLCSNGTDLPDPQLEVVPGKTCQALQYDADADFDDDCKWWQAIAGPPCGCPRNENLQIEDLCQICPGKVLPEPGRMLNLIDGTTASCLMLELEVNTNGNAICGPYQQAYADPCGCFESEDAPDQATPPSAARGNVGRLGRWATLFLIFCLTTFRDLW